MKTNDIDKSKKVPWCVKSPYLPSRFGVISPSSGSMSCYSNININIKCKWITLYNCILHCTISTRAQSVRRQQRKRTSEESEMVTYNHVTEVVRSKCVNHQARRVDSRAILILIATSVGALIIPTIKQTATYISHQTNKLNKWNCTHIIRHQYILDHWRVIIKLF